jgi:hypothetical protein
MPSGNRLGCISCHLGGSIPARVGLIVLGLIFLVIVKLSVPLNAPSRHDEIVELGNDQSCTKVNNESNASLFSDIAAEDNCKH